jgi:hypothetical protein
MNKTNHKIILDLFDKGWTESEIAEATTRELSDVHNVLVEEGVIVDEEPTAADDLRKIGTIIPYKEFDYMLKCKNVVDTILASAELNLNDPSRIFVNSKYVMRALCTNLPNEVKQRTKELTEAGVNTTPEFI